MRSPSSVQQILVAWPARMSLITLSFTAWSKSVVISAIGVALPVVLVVKLAHDPRHWGAAQLLAAFGGSRIVHHPIRVREDGADECDSASVRRPRRRRSAFGHGAQLLSSSAGGDVEDEELVRGPDPADEGELAPVGRPLPREFAQHAPRDPDRLGTT